MSFRNLELEGWKEPAGQLQPSSPGEIVCISAHCGFRLGKPALTSLKCLFFLPPLCAPPPAWLTQFLSAVWYVFAILQYIWRWLLMSQGEKKTQWQKCQDKAFPIQVKHRLLRFHIRARRFFWSILGVFKKFLMSAAFWITFMNTSFLML